MRHYYDIMKKKPRKSLEEGGSPLESLRLQYTELNQDAFCLACGIPRATYQRMARGTSETRFTIEQIINICHVCGISPETFLKTMGGDVEHIPSAQK